VREAGGFVTDGSGGEGAQSGESIIAGNHSIHRALLATLAPAGAPSAAAPSGAAPELRA